MGVPLRTLLARKEDEELLETMMAALTRDEPPDVLEIDFSDARGAPCPVALRGRALAASGMDDRTAVLMARDMRDIRRLMEAEADATEAAHQRARELSAVNLQLRNTQAQLVQAGKLAALGQLSGAVAHELNNPLMGLSLATKLLAEDIEALGLDDDRRANLLANINRLRSTTTRCAGVVSALLAFGRQSKGERFVIDLSDVVRSTVDLVRHKMHLANVSVVLELPPDELRVRANGNQIGQVVLNLVLNASDVMSEGGVVQITGMVNAGEVHLAIRDEGPGIPKAVQERMFEPFFTTKPTGQGTGLGLAISHGIVEEHGGRILVESAIDKGTTFTLVFPAA